MHPSNVRSFRFARQRHPGSEHRLRHLCDPRTGLLTAATLAGEWGLDAVETAETAEGAAGNTESPAGFLVAGVDTSGPLDPVLRYFLHFLFPVCCVASTRGESVAVAKKNGCGPPDSLSAARSQKKTVGNCSLRFECLSLELSQPPGSPVAAGLISGLRSTEWMNAALGAWPWPVADKPWALSPIWHVTLCCRANRSHHVIDMPVCPRADVTDVFGLSILISDTVSPFGYGLMGLVVSKRRPSVVQRPVARHVLLTNRALLTMSRVYSILLSFFSNPCPLLY